MHLSMHNWMRAEPLEVTVRRLARYGYESIEISGEPDQYDTAEVSRILKENRIRCWGAVTLMLDGHEMTIVPGEVGVVVPASTPEVEWGWAVEGMKEIYDHAQQAGVRLAVEPLNRFETYFVSRADQALALAEATGPECGVCLDAFHLNIEDADPFQAILDVGDRLVDFHVADTNRLACGMGHWDWARVVETLKQAGYDGALTVEFVAPIDRTPANPFPDALETEPVDISEEQRKFIEDHGSDLLSEAFYDSLVAKTAETILPLIGRS